MNTVGSDHKRIGDVYTVFCSKLSKREDFIPPSPPEQLMLYRINSNTCYSYTIIVGTTSTIPVSFNTKIQTPTSDFFSHISGSYNNSSGTFTAPVDGVYVFSVTMHSLNHDTTHHGIYKNSEQITTLYVHGGELATSDSTSQTIILVLKRGDTVSVRHIDADHGAYGSGHSLFSGFLLYERESELEIVG